MAFVNAVTTATAAASTHALLVPNQSFSLVLVRAGIQLTASGTNSNAIRAQADNLTLAMDGYAASEEAQAIFVIGGSEILIGASGVVASGDRAIQGSGADNEITNNGSLVSNSIGIYLSAGGHSVANNGTILSGSGVGIYIADGDSQVINAGVLNSGSSGITIDSSDAFSGSLVTNSGQINADFQGISLGGSNVLVANSGTIQAGTDGIRGNGADAEFYVVTNTGTISADDNAISLDGGNNSVVNSGSILAEAAGVTIGGANNQITNSGTIAAASGIVALLGARIVNDGIIQSNLEGIQLGGFGTGINHVTNTGTIVSAIQQAIELNSSADGAVLINSGTLATQAALMEAVQFTTSFNTRLVNSGLISAADGGTAITMGAGADRVINSGVIHGDVNLFDGADVYRARKSGVVEGQVKGSFGNDTLLGGNGADDMDGGDDDDLIRGGAGDDTLAGGTGNDELEFGTGDDSYIAGNSDGNDDLDGGDGIDTYDARGLVSGIIVRLHESRAVGTAIGHDVVLFFENVFGGSGGDSLIGDAARNVLRGNGGADNMNGLEGNDRIVGGNGNDVIIGNTGRDVMTGGADADVFDFNSTADSTVGDSNRDVITDFEIGVDHIDLSTIDANTALGGNQAFTFIGNGVFTSVAGQLRFTSFVGTDYTVVEGDVNGDGKADFTIGLFGATALVAGDFVL
ncbi:hypothetical protein [Aestuariivirga sp.]|uniref:hypothetical protein n=1 Tax=Aestuariivirga sp. TaxID=2650926 RepID=UPI003593DCCD